MLDLFNIAKPQGCDIQTFYGSNTYSSTTQAASRGSRTWNKPRGVSHIYMMLIGAGGSNGTDSTYRGSGAVTVWYGAAQNVPDKLVVSVSNSNNSSSNTYISKEITSAGDLDILLNAGSGPSNTTSGGAAMTANQFTASGFFQSVAGDDGGTTVASPTTFLAGGGNPANYGYGLTKTMAQAKKEMAA